MEQTPLKTFIIYASVDESLKNELVRHLQPLVKVALISIWHEGYVRPGEDWEEAIMDELNTSDLVLMLVSADALDSEFIHKKELAISLQRFRQGELKSLVPIIIRNCGWRWDETLNGFQALPRPLSGDVVAVSDPIWGSRDTAWTNITDALGELAQNLLNRQKTATDEFRNRKVMQEEADKFGLDADAWKKLLREKIAFLKISGPLGRVHLVNCNRGDLRDRFSEGFAERQKSAFRNHFYFLSACPTQLPPSFGERMVYEMLGDLMDENPEGVFCKFEPKNHNRVLLEKLPVGYSLEESKDLFRKFCTGWFSWEKDVSFEKALTENRLPLSKFKYSILPFYLRKKEWRPFVPQYLQWIMEQLNQRTEGGPTVLFFNIFYHENLHRNCDARSREIIDAIDKYCESNQAAGHFYPLEPVETDDLRYWFEDLGEMNRARLEPVLKTLELGLEAEDLEQFRRRQKLNMDDVELVQELVFEMWERGEI
ncbi:MAG: toll/interleukin-1 receptor domain-containing protein [Saprospiraceae bacterium]|jgi:hypothetical protein|nr:toll/interleukin-1 receptor domain-containing protein [Saprospiraceae bacterium]